MSPAFIAEVKTLGKSFIITVATGAAIAGAQWLGAHIPTFLQWLGTLAAAYGSMKYYQA